MLNPKKSRKDAETQRLRKGFKRPGPKGFLCDPFASLRLCVRFYCFSVNSFSASFVLMLGMLSSAHAQSPWADSSRAWVIIETRQPGLTVFIDAQEAGKTPLLNFAVTPGAHDFAVRRSFSASWLESDWSERIDIPAGDTLTLTPKFSIGYTISSTPAHAQVWVEGRYLGTTPYVLRMWDDASARVTLILQNYQSTHFEIKPANGAGPEDLQRQSHLALTPVPSSLSSLTYDNDLRAARDRQRKWGYLAAGVSVAAGIGAMLLKQQADEAYAAYLVTGAPAAREQYYNRAQQYDRYYSVAFGVSQVTLVFSVYSFLKSVR